MPVGGGKSYFLASSFAEMLPRAENRVTLDPVRRDAWGIPVLRIDCTYDEAQLAMVPDQTQALRELAELAEVQVIDWMKSRARPALRRMSAERRGWDMIR